MDVDQGDALVGVEQSESQRVSFRWVRVGMGVCSRAAAGFAPADGVA